MSQIYNVEMKPDRPLGGVVTTKISADSDEEAIDTAKNVAFMAPDDSTLSKVTKEICIYDSEDP